MAENGGTTGNDEIHTVQDYINTHRVEKGNEFTHTSLAKPVGSFYVPAEEMDMFYDLYTTALQLKQDLHVTEKNRHVGPILIDLDFRFKDLSNLSRRYTDEHVDDIVGMYVDTALEYLDMADDEKVEIFVMQKDAPYVDKNTLKDGLHIVFPNLITRASVKHAIRNKMLRLLADVVKSIGADNKIDDIVDEAVIQKNNWFMFGSRKPDPSGGTYKVTRVFEFTKATNTIVEVDNNYTDGELVRKLSIRNKYTETPVVDGMKAELQEFEKKIDKQRRTAQSTKAIITAEPNMKLHVCEDIECVKKLVAILSADRASNYNDWIRVGWCLRNIDNRLMEEWIEFSKRSPKFVSGECERIWNNMRDGGLGIGTLHMWAKLDNPTEYRTIIRSDLKNLIYASTSGTHYDVACVVHHMYKHEFVCASIKNRCWYEFRDHRWHPSDSGFGLRMRISDEVWREYHTAAIEYTQAALSTLNGGDQQRYTELAKRMNDIAIKLRTTSFKENLMKECSELFYVEKFEEKLDSNPSLIGFENGVYDLDTLEFREGRPEDYISFSTRNSYIEYDPHHPAIAEINTYLSQVLTKPQVRDYVMKLFASFLNGAIKEQKFYIWTGSGCHAYNTAIMMADGSIRKVQDIRVGDQLMGDDSTPRNVQQLFRGHADMYRIVPVKGEPFVVNGDHVLSLQVTNMTTMYQNKQKDKWMVRYAEHCPVNILEIKNKTFDSREDAEQHLEKVQQLSNYVKKGDVVDVKVVDYLKNIKRIGKLNLYLYRPKFVEFSEKEVDMDPYVLGAWLGDGTSRTFAITSMDPEIMNYVKEHAPTCEFNEYIKKNNKATYYTARKKEGRKMQRNDLNKALDKYGLVNNKHIPFEYKCNSKEVRMKVLAGIIDTDGTYQKHTNQFTINLKNERLIDDVVYVARSLGFACYKRQIQGKCCNNGKVGTYYAINIVGEGIEDIPTLLERKKARKRVKSKDVRRVGFKVEHVGNGDYYGFELDGNHRYLLETLTVSHNSNSKTCMVDLFERSFGEYCCKFPITLLTQKRAASNAAQSELARAKGKRFATLQEPSEDEKLNIGLMKELSGGDVILARAIYKEPIEFKPMFKMLLLCNQLPHVPSDDGGTWRRIRVVEFTSKFVETPVNENEFAIDYELFEKFPRWQPHFMALVLEYYKHYLVEGASEPEDVTKCTLEYKAQNDHLTMFINTHIEKKDIGFLSLDDVYQELRNWIRDDGVPCKTPSKPDLERYLNKNLTKCVVFNHTKGFKGYRMINQFENTLEADDKID